VPHTPDLAFGLPADLPIWGAFWAGAPDIHPLIKQVLPAAPIIWPFHNTTCV
jgi:hypothetical protein